MNEDLNLEKILKYCQKGTKLYSTVFGEVKLEEVKENSKYPIMVKPKIGGFESFTSSGRWMENYDGECTLFPSKDQRDWSKFKPKFNPKTLQPFDKVLARMSNESYNTWYADFVAEPVYTEDETPLTLGAKEANMVIPYNDDTKHLIGTTEEAPEFYKYWETN